MYCHTSLPHWGREASSPINSLSRLQTLFFPPLFMTETVSLQYWKLQGKLKLWPQQLGDEGGLRWGWVLGCTPQTCKPCACPASRQKKEPWSQQQRHQWFNGRGSLHVWSKVLEWHPIVCSSHDMAAAFVPRGGGRFPVIGGVDVRLAHGLPGKLTEGCAPHHSFDKNNH